MSLYVWKVLELVHSVSEDIQFPLFDDVKHSRYLILSPLVRRIDSGNVSFMPAIVPS